MPSKATGGTHTEGECTPQAEPAAPPAWSTPAAVDRCSTLLGVDSKELRAIYQASGEAVMTAAARLGLDPQPFAAWLTGEQLTDIILAATKGHRPLVYRDPGEELDRIVGDVQAWLEREQKQVTRELRKIDKLLGDLRKEVDLAQRRRRFWEKAWAQP